MTDLLFLHCHAATMDRRFGAYGAIRDAAVAVQNGRISWVGPEKDLPAGARRDATRCIDARGAWLLPGLIDCHTHLVFAGNRADEFEQRASGKTYAQIAQAGGGILRTVQATRAASFDELVRLAVERAAVLRREGVTTIEAKSGYGLDRDTELRVLHANAAVPARAQLRVESTYLGAHALPPEFAGRRAEYLALVCEQMIPEIAAQRLASAVDVFCEHLGFTIAETEQVLWAARAAGLAVKIHAEQLSNTGAAALAARYGALSADHLEYLDASGIDAMAHAGTTAVLLPLPFYYLQERQVPPVEALRRAGVPIAIASDLNPGSAPLASLLLALNMATLLFGLSSEEALFGATTHAARALGLAADRGLISVAQRADLALWPIDHPRELVATVGLHQPSAVYLDGAAN
jgi:imidazolonepropionase